MQTSKVGGKTQQLFPWQEPREGNSLFGLRTRPARRVLKRQRARANNQAVTSPAARRALTAAADVGAFAGGVVALAEPACLSGVNQSDGASASHCDAANAAGYLRPGGAQRGHGIGGAATALPCWSSTGQLKSVRPPATSLGAISCPTALMPSNRSNICAAADCSLRSTSRRSISVRRLPVSCCRKRAEKSSFSPAAAIKAGISLRSIPDIAAIPGIPSRITCG